MGSSMKVLRMRVSIIIGVDWLEVSAVWGSPRII